MNSEMKAWTFSHGGYPKALHESTLPIDLSPLKPMEIRIRTKAAALNPIDTQLMGFFMLPYIPSFVMPAQKGVGEDFSGIVEASGSDSGFKVGSEVFGIVPFLPGGTLQEFLRLDTKTAVVLPKPNTWSWQQAAAIPLVWITAQTIIHAVEPYVSKGGKVGVLGGSSSTGMFVTHIAKQRGWIVTASCSGRNAEFVRSMGADETIDYTINPVREQMKTFEPDAIIDCVGGAECVGIARRYVTVVGDKTKRMSMGGKAIYLWNPQMLLRSALGRMGLGPSYSCLNLDVKVENLESVLSLPEDKIKIDSVFEFGDVIKAFEKLNSSRARGKVVINIAL